MTEKKINSRRRGNGEGSIGFYNGKWRLTISIGRKLNGSLDRRCYYFETEAEAKSKKIEVLAALHNETFVKDTKITLVYWMVSWLRDYKIQELKPSTYQNYECYTRIHIIPLLGKKKINEIRPVDIQKFVNALKRTKSCNNPNQFLAPMTIKKVLLILKSALDAAVDNGLITNNPAVKIVIKEDKKAERIPFTAEEESIYLQYAKGYQYYPLFALAFSTGARLGELLGLQWQDIDLTNKQIYIRRSYNRARQYKEDGSFSYVDLYQSPKSRSSIRTIPLPDKIIEPLKQLHMTQMSVANGNEKKYQNADNLVFTSSKGTILNGRNVLRAHEAIMRKADLEYRSFHCIRHSYATRLVDLDVHPKVAQELLGHSDPKVTLNVYSHVSDTKKQEAIKKFNEISCVKEDDSHSNYVA